jgi:hypothetical protein
VLQRKLVAVIQDNLDLNRIKQKVILAWHRPEEGPTPERWGAGIKVY